MNHWKFMAWLFGVGFWAQTILVNIAINQRDEARAAISAAHRIEMNGNTVVLVCTEEHR